uniref:hypothetical protein n=1 Tax=Aeromonas hydrophila TaxID=644 RepID=UPI003D2363E8
NKMRTPDQIAEKSESSIKSQGMIPPWGEKQSKKNIWNITLSGRMFSYAIRKMGVLIYFFMKIKNKAF